MATTDIDPCRATTGLDNESFGTDCKGNVVKRVADDCATEVLENILIALGGSASGTPFHLPTSNVTLASGLTLTALTSTVPAATTRTISKVIVSTRAAGSFEIKSGGSVIGSGRTNAANLNVEFNYSPGIAVATGVTIDVEFTMLHGKIGQDVEVYLMATDS